MLFAVVALTFTACKKDEDPCEGVTCLNNGQCNDGTCNCAAGYQGTDCGTEMRAKFLGVYNVSESCTSGNYTYQININTSASGVANVVIGNFGGVGASVIASVNGSAITIANQTIDVQGTPVTFSGSGQISGSILTISYTLSAAGTSDPCTSTCTKQ